MLKIKKYLSVLIAAVMLLSSVSVLAEGETAVQQFPDLDANSAVGQAVAELVPYGIINGYEDGTFRPDNTITRAEFAKIIVTFLNLQNIGAEGLASGFGDVDTATPHWAQKFIRIAVDRGIVNGYNDGTFKPDNPVKASEAVKMIVCALNWGDVALSRTPAAGPWYAGYVAQAADLGILNKVSIGNQEDAAARGIVAMLVCNALDAKVAVNTTTGSGATSTTEGESSAREEFLNTQKVTGVVVSCEQTNLNISGAIQKSRLISVKVDGKVKTYKVPSDTDTMSLLGYRITANINEESIGDYAEISAITKDSVNRVTKIDASNIANADVSKVEYWETEEALRTKTITFDSNVVFVYNGKYLPAGELTEADINIKAGNLTLVSNDGNSSIDVVFINNCEIFAVNSSGVDSDTKLKKIYTLYGGGDIIVPEKGDFVTVNNKGTDVIDTSSFSVSKYDIINLYRSKDGEVFKMTITKDKKSGSVDEKSAAGITVKGKEYKFAYNFLEYEGADKPVFAIGNNANVYLDADGKIAAAENTSTSADSSVYVGYVVGAEKGEGINGVAKIGLFGISSGKTGEKAYTLANKVRVDGTLYQDANDAIDAVKSAAAIVRDGKDALNVETTLYSQLIRYTLNSDNKIDTIDTIAENLAVAADDMAYSLPLPNTTDSRYNAETIGTEAGWNGKYKFVSGNTFVNEEGGTVMGINSNTKVLVVPEDPTDYSKYRNSSSSYFTTSKSYTVEGYCLSDTKIAQYVVVYPGEDDIEFTYQSDIALVKYVRQGSPDQGVDLTSQDRVIGYNFKNGAEIKEDNPLKADKENLFYSNLQAGEIFRYAKNNDYATKIEMIFEIDADGNPVLFREQLSEGEETVNALDPVSTFRAAKSVRDIQFDEDRAQLNASSCRIVYGTVVAKSQDDDGKNRTINLSYNIYTDDCGVNPDNVVIFNLNSSAKIFMIDLTKTNDDEIISSNIDFNELNALTSPGVTPEEASQVLMFYSGSTVRAMYIIKTPAPVVSE